MKKNLLSILALSLGMSSFAQIVHTDNNDITLTPVVGRETSDIDLDGDMVVDFTVFALDTTVNSVPVKAIGITFKNSNEAAGSVQNVPLGDFLKLDALNSGDDINSSLNYVNNSSSSNLVFDGGGLALYSAIMSAGDFMNTTDKYIAVKFTASGSTYHGWIRVDVADDAASVTIKDFAYESTAGDAIRAGDNGNGFTAVSEKELANASVFFGNNELNINGITGNYSVAVVDLLGKSISNTSISNNASINLGNVNNGIYLVQITKGNSVVTKKIYIK